jgi:hypothetical protein
VITFCTVGLAADRDARPKRALPPQWSQEVLDTFFPDAREQLQGERPDYAALAKSRGGAGRAAPDGETMADGGGGRFAWSTLVRPETLEDEVKRTSSRLAPSIETPTGFKGGGYRECRREFSLLGVLFGVIGEYDQGVRWKEEAPAYRDLFARAGFNCQVGSDQSLREAQGRVQDLAQLIRGSRIEAEAEAPESAWPDVADRVPLMQRMEQAHDQRLSKWLASRSEFRGNLDEIRHEAELLAVLAEVVSREGYEFADDEEYAGYADRLREGARGIAEAAASDDFERAGRAAAAVTKACYDCHEAFRG